MKRGIYIMANNKFYTVKKEIKGKEYVAQFNGLLPAVRAVDNSYIEGSNNTSIEKLSKYILENVIVSPKGLNIDSFETMDEFNEVIAFGREVMQGDFRDKKDETTAKK